MTPIQSVGWAIFWVACVWGLYLPVTWVLKKLFRPLAIVHLRYPNEKVTEVSLFADRMVVLREGFVLEKVFVRHFPKEAHFVFNGHAGIEPAGVMQWSVKGVTVGDTNTGVFHYPSRFSPHIFSWIEFHIVVCENVLHTFKIAIVSQNEALEEAA